MNNVATPRNFIGVSIDNQKIIIIISALQMSQALCLPKSKVEIIDVCYLNLVASMVAILCVHSLHLTKMVIGLSLRGSSKRTLPSNVGGML
jgi:hypothetical protein